MVGPNLVGTMPFDGLLERLHGGHLRPWLVAYVADAYLAAVGSQRLAASPEALPPVKVPPA